MAEKKSPQKEDEQKRSKTQKKKASTGPWWKSTEVEGIPLPNASSSTAANGNKPIIDGLPAPPSAPESSEKKDESGENSVAVVGENIPAKKPRRRPQSRKKTTATPSSQDTETPAKKDESPPAAESTPQVASTAPESAKAEAGVPAEKPKPRRKRGRPRKKPQEKKEEGQEGQDSGGQEIKPDAAEEKQNGGEAAGQQEPQPAVKTPKKPGRKRSPRKKKSETEHQQTTEEYQQAQESTTQSSAKKEVAGTDGSVDKGSEAREEKEQAGKPAAKKEANQQHKPLIKLLINAEEPEECRLALLEDGRLESIHVATSTRAQTKNNIYKAKIMAIEPNLQAAFVDYGTEKNGFLPFSEIHPEYYKENVSDKVQHLIDQQQWKKLSITDVIERGREVLVQVVKEEVGKKGANMTTYLSLPGRCVVLMPGSDSKGISRKISGEEQRSLLRDHMLSMNIPEGIGWIVRTASIDITKTALGRDVNYLQRLWDEVKKKGQELESVGLIYQDHDHVLRFLREHFDPDIQEILVDEKDALEQVKGFVELLPAKQRKVRCKLHRGARPIFNQYSIEDQIESIYQPKVNLPSGGSIVIDPTEALVAIDVNSGSTQKGKNFEDTIFQANMEAATELARQLRLRDLGGLIVVDFIDMRSKKNTREVEKQVKSAMKRDKAKVDISRISKFGLMQISRQKLGAPIEAGNYRVCGSCKGRGVVRSVETMALFYLRRIHTAASRKMVRQIECRFPLDVAGYLLNNKRQELRDLELKYDTEVVIIADPSLNPGEHDIAYHKSENDIGEKNNLDK